MDRSGTVLLSLAYRMIAPAEPASRIFRDPINDSSRWQDFRPREGDIVVCTPPKSGTTWMQGILAMLISGDPGVDAQTSTKSPWIDIAVRPFDEVMERLDAQDHRRQVKSHSPFDCIPYWDALRYITVYRHPIDVHFSSRKHMANIAHDVGLDPMPEDPRESFQAFLVNDRDHLGLPLILDHFRATLARKERGNLICLHYADMLHDLPGAVAQIAKHTGIRHAPDLMDAIADAARFDSMRANAARFTPSAGHAFWRNDTGFFDSASCNKWEGILTEDDLAAYGDVVDAVLSPAERRWLEWGSGPSAQGPL